METIDLQNMPVIFQTNRFIGYNQPFILSRDGIELSECVGGIVNFNDKATIVPQSHGAYMVIHAPTLSKYIGSSNNLYTRFRAHRSGLLKGKHYCNGLLELYNRSNPNDFRFVWIKVNNRDVAYDIEQSLLDADKDCSLLLNSAIDARAPGKGYVMSPEHKAILLNANKTPERAAATSNYMKTRWQEPAFRVNMLEKRKSFRLSPESRAKISASKRGIKPTEAARKRHSEVCKSPEHRAKLSKAFTGRKQSQETKDKRALSSFGKRYERKVSIDGTFYSSLTVASKALNVCINTIRNRVASDLAKYDSYYFL